MRTATAPGISRALARLFRCAGQVAYALLTHSPLGSYCYVLARLACIRHSTSVRSEPGSNSSLFSKVCPARFSSRSSTGASLKHISKSFNKPARRLVRGVLGLPDRNDANYRIPRTSRQGVVAPFSLTFQLQWLFLGIFVKSTILSPVYKQPMRIFIVRERPSRESFVPTRANRPCFSPKFPKKRAKFSPRTCFHICRAQLGKLASSHCQTCSDNPHPQRDSPVKPGNDSIVSMGMTTDWKQFVSNSLIPSP